MAVLAAFGASFSDGDVRHPSIAVAAGSCSLVALLAASVRLRSRPASMWAASQRDPFPALAGALAMLMLRPLSRLLPYDQLELFVDRHHWAVAGAAGLLGCLGMSVIVRDVAPGRTLDALYLAAIAASGIGLVAWVGTLNVVDGDPITVGRSVSLLAPVVLDLVVVALGLQAMALRSRARVGYWALVLAWTLVLVSDVGHLLRAVTGSDTTTGVALVPWVLAFGLLGAAALHPHTAEVTEPVIGPLHRLPRSQVSLLAVGVLIGPAILALGLHEPRSVPTGFVLSWSGGLSVLVVAYLVHLVQGRAVFEHRAHHDELTGLANRTLFEDRAAVALAHARRTGGHSAVLFLDLDRFKNVNDSLGHAVGNLLLQAVAKRLHSATRAEDTVARLGGDEFVVFLPELADPDEAATVAAKVLERFEEPFTLAGHRLFASPSIGVAVFPEDGEEADALLKNADTAMYRAKQRGRRTFCAYDRSMNDHAHERLALESRLHGAVERDELRLFYQPKIHLPTGRVMGMEALLRWEHPDLGLLEPSAFIPLAEESGLIVPVGEWALQEACRQNHAWVAAGFEPLVVAVNLSLRQFQQGGIEDMTARILRSTGLHPSLLELEVTESLAMQDPDTVRSTLLDLREMGVTCSIDDFGTGYSGLSHLMRFPIDKLKIDKSFVATIDVDRDAPIVVAVVALAHGLGLEVVAEGVETDGQLERLQELGCDEMQGYLFSRPLTPERFEQLLMLEAIAPGPGRLAPSTSGRPRLIQIPGGAA
ncbi:MAG: putative bifunctional diguanylate cyclase/phosphodiesterase [Acidimicrobiales bacterium]